MGKNLHPINSAPSNLKTEDMKLSTYLMIWWWPQGGHWAVGAGVDIMKSRGPNFPTPGANWKSKMSPWSLWDSGGPRTAHQAHQAHWAHHRRHGLQLAPPQFGKPVGKDTQLRSWIKCLIFMTILAGQTNLCTTHYANQYERYESKNRSVNPLECDYNNIPIMILRPHKRPF